ncbi:MAG: class I SAM-dependent methyltransferase [Nitrospirae bacterium]|nr:class I SAM-dependent methyltransferase [Nitrospirota bacterium]
MRYLRRHGLRKTLARSFFKLSELLECPDALSYTGERVVPAYKNDCFYAHLSIYNFAKDFVLNKAVLDAGCGSGYGTHYLATHGAKTVCGIDIGEDAVKFATENYQQPNLKFIQMDCENINLDKQSFDVVFSSNMIEHLENYHAFLKGVKDVLKDDGVFILATPPLYGFEPVEDNPFHHTNLKVGEWIDILSGYYTNIETFRHLFKTNKKNKHGDPYVLDFANKPKDCTIDEKDFFFEKVPVSTYLNKTETLTALFVISGKR